MAVVAMRATVVEDMVEAGKAMETVVEDTVVVATVVVVAAAAAAVVMTTTPTAMEALVVSFYVLCASGICKLFGRSRFLVVNPCSMHR